jgi:hypothetical protein
MTRTLLCKNPRHFGLLLLRREAAVDVMRTTFQDLPALALDSGALTLVVIPALSEWDAAVTVPADGTLT